MNLEPIFKREQAAIGRKRYQERNLSMLQQRRLDVERQAGEAMLLHGAIPPEVRKALQEVRDDIQAAEYACSVATSGVDVARLEDQAETIARDMGLLRELLQQREAHAAEVQGMVAGMEAAARQLREVENQIMAIVGSNDAVGTDAGWLVHPAAESLRMPIKELLAGAVKGEDIATSVARETGLLLTFYEQAAPQRIEARARRVAENHTEEPTHEEQQA